MSDKSYKIVFGYTSDLVRKYSDQIEVYLLDFLMATKGTLPPERYGQKVLTAYDYCDGMDLYLSSNWNWPAMYINNIDREPSEVYCNTMDLEILREGDFFSKGVVEPHSLSDYENLMGEKGDVFTFRFMIPYYESTDTEIRYNHRDGEKFKAEYGTNSVLIHSLEFLKMSEIADTCANNKTIYIGSVAVVMYETTKEKEYVTTGSFDECKEWLTAHSE